MKVKVLLPFNDKYNLARTFNPGEVVDFEEQRANDIVTRGLGAFDETREPYRKPVAEKPVEKVEKTPAAEIVETPIAAVAEKVEESITEDVKVEENAEPTESEEKVEESAEEKVEKKRHGRKPKNAE